MRVATPWIYSAKFDACAIIGPPLAIACIVLGFGRTLEQISEPPIWLWVLVVLGVDVGHVYSSLYRTYFDKEELARRKRLYVLAPLMAWGLGSLIYVAFGLHVFWSLVAYFAIYHFVRQQYGFFMLYRRQEPKDTLAFRLDQAVIYLATLYPLVYWHTYPRNFEWFSNFAMLKNPWPWLERVTLVVYVSSLLAYAIKEAWLSKASGTLNAGKSALLVVTALSWYVGIVMFNGDLTFTLVNILAHGIPYIALVWIYQFRKARKQSAPAKGLLRFFQLKYVPLYVLSLMALAFFEEGLWDYIVWKENPALFGNWTITLPPLLLGLVVPLLTMPQVTHYILDAFIWRVSKPGSDEVRAVIG